MLNTSNAPPAVVLGVMLFLGVVLSLYDLVWLKTFSWIGILDQRSVGRCGGKHTVEKDGDVGTLSS